MPLGFHRDLVGKRTGRFWLSGGVSATLTAVLGLVLLLSHLGGGLTRFSYDLPFALRGDIPASDAAIVYLDEASHKELDQPRAAPWDRALHARLISQLTAQGAKAIVFDILFTEASANPAADEQLLNAIRLSNRVILASNFERRETTSGMNGSWEELPYEPFRNVCVGWGNANLAVDPDYGIRNFYPAVHDISGVSVIPWLPEAVAKFAGAPQANVRSSAFETRYLNYYGRPGTLPGISYFQALLPDGAPPGFFKGKIVFVGAQMSADFSGKGKDEFLTPYAFWGAGFAPGVEIHATAALNILRGEWLERFPPWVELGLLLVIAVLAGFGLVRVSPLTAVLVSMLVALVVAMLAHYLAWRHQLWFGWLIVECELGLALLCSVIYNSLRLYVEKKLLEQSLAKHLSPALVKRMLADPQLRRRGGTKTEVSMLFTDLENFSRISETLHPNDLVDLLNQYFEVALQCVHETDGTVMDLVGDAIFAIWNAPIEQPDHRERACRAALLLRQRLTELEAGKLGFPLRTRAGLHTGPVCVGNIGSEQRFDYAAVGENTNLASRLEGLNKHLGTTILATREIHRVAEHNLTCRPVGLIQVKGFARAVEVFELLGPAEQAEASRPWREKFAEALRLFRASEFDAADLAFQETIRLRSKCEATPDSSLGKAPMDGPSKFYIDRIADFRKTPPPSNWIGEVGMKDK